VDMCFGIWLLVAFRRHTHWSRERSHSIVWSQIKSLTSTSRALALFHCQDGGHHVISSLSAPTLTVATSIILQMVHCHIVTAGPFGCAGAALVRP
jgi:hypothetical protein